MGFFVLGQHISITRQENVKLGSALEPVRHLIGKIPLCELMLVGELNFKGFHPANLRNMAG